MLRALQPQSAHLLQLVASGAAKAQLSWVETIGYSILGGAYISFGALFALSVGCACPGLAATDPGKGPPLKRGCAVSCLVMAAAALCLQSPGSKGVTCTGLQRLVLGVFGLPLGLILVMMTGVELFTGNTMILTMAVRPVPAGPSPGSMPAAARACL